MAHKFDPDRMEVLHSDERKRIFPADTAIEILGCGEGDTVADIGCGTGYLTIPVARSVGVSGLVYAFDTSERMLGVLEKRAGNEELMNIRTVLSEEYKLPVEKASCRRAVMSSVFHEVDDRVLFARTAFDILAPGGSLTVFEMIPGVVGVGPPEHHRVSSEEVAADMAAAGYAITDGGNMNEFFYYVTGRKQQ